MPTEPKRKHQLTLTIGADSLEDLHTALEQLSTELRPTGNKSFGGGYTWGHILEHTVDPEQTHERFCAQLESYLAALKKLEG